MPGTNWSAEVTELIPHQTTHTINTGSNQSGGGASGTVYDCAYYSDSSAENLSGTADSETITVKSFNPKSVVIIIGSVLTKVNTGGVVTGTEDTRKNVTYYSCISAKVTYYKYSSKTLAYRSSK